MLSSSASEKQAATSIVKKMKDFWELKSAKANDEIIVSSEKQTGNATSINCAVKAITIQQTHIIHQVELTCSCCSSVFIVRAAHDCCNVADDAGFAHDDGGAGEEEEETGLEWLGATGEQQQINLTI